MEVGAVGSVTDTVLKLVLTEVSPLIIQELQQQPPRSRHELFAVYRQSVAGVSDPGERQFQIGANGSSQSFLMWYLAAPPTLTDVATENSGLDRIPAAYHFSYLLNKVKAKISFANEATRDLYEAAAGAALVNAIRTDGQGRNSSILAMPSAQPGKW
jgi:hypothetical protein